MSATISQWEVDTPITVPRREGRRVGVRWCVILLLVWVLAGVYMGSKLMHGWVPHDEGAFAQSADRVLRGELPHRDYSEIYTGGLAYLHAWAFRYLGEKLGTLRIVLFIFFLLWVPAFYWIASRLVEDWIAAGVTMLAVAWSVPNYPAAVPSWYNLFLATFGLAALLMYLEKRSARWLFLAGVCGGISFLVKNAALFYMAAVLLFFLFHEQNISRSRASAQERRSPLYSAFLALSTAMFPLAAAMLVRSRGGIARSVDFVLPSAVLAAVILLREARLTGSTSRERFGRLMRMSSPFAIGFVVPMLLFALMYLRAKALGALCQGVFVVPFKRVFGAVMDPPEMSTILPSICLVGVLAISTRLREALRWIGTVLALGAAAYSLLSFSRDAESYHATWYGAYWSIPVLSVIGGFLLWPRAREKDATEDATKDDKLFLLLAICALCGLIQYPFSGPIYFCYVAPFVALAAVCVVKRFPSIPRSLLAIVFSWFLVFAFLRVAPLFNRVNQHIRTVNLPRVGRLSLDMKSASTYERLVPFVREHAASGGVYAAPDCPQVYFLSGLANPTRSLFDFLEPDYEDSARILRIVTPRSIQVVVINNKPSFSAPIPADVRRELNMLFPKRETIGDFEVLWRD
jgi:hypothetical protein